MRLDILIPIAIYLLVTLLVGSYFQRYLRGKETNFNEEFFVGGRSLGPLVLAFTLVASTASAGTFIGATGVGYEQGFSWPLIIASQTAMGLYVLGVLGKKFAIIARRIDAVTLTDFLKVRYESKTVVILSSLGILIFISAYMIAQFAGGARILEAATGFPYHWGLIIFGGVVVLLTVFGGYRGVAFTDAMQGIAMLMGGIIIWIIIMVKTDGFSAIVSDLTVNHPDLVTIPGGSGATPSLLFSYLLLFGIAMLGLPHVAVRGMTFKDSKSMHKGIVYSVIIMGLFSIGFASIGPMLRVIMPGVEPDMAVLLFLVESVPGWLAGLMMAAPLAAIISTVDSMLLVVSSSIVKDLYINYINPKASEKSIKKLSYFSTLIIGIVVVLISITPPDFIQTIVIFSIGGLEATLFSVIVFGLYWKRANRWGAISSMILGFFVYLIIVVFFDEQLFGMHAVATSLFISIASMIFVSYLTEKPRIEVINKIWGDTPPTDSFNKD